jgi:hypothetical protein
MSFKVFAAGEKLTASDVNTYLMQQAVMFFATSVARDAAITAPVEGMVAYLEDTNIYTFYNGTAWGNLLWGDAWIAYTPTLSNITLGSGGTSAFFYQRVGKMVNVRGRITLGTSGALTGVATFTLPSNAISSDQFWNSGCVLNDSGTTFYPGMVRVGTSTATVLALNAAGTYTTAVNTSAIIPFTWAINDVINVGFSYESV